ncbi:MAG: exonuclease SbcCD subunit D [Polyangiaceae bacterium]|nr:exonuclease SbcCD subunit D [Polyangiaceae bacterium]
MTGVRFLHTADWQLGMRRHYLDEDALPRFAQARIEAIRTIAELARAENTMFVSVCGDVWESNQLSPRVVGRALEALSTIPCPVYLLPGNHDPLDSGSVYRSPAFAGTPSNVHVIETRSPVTVAPDVEIFGAPWRSKTVRRDLVSEACAELEPMRTGVRICLGHGIVDELAPNRNDPAAISRRAMDAALADGRVHYFALGDRHSTTRVAERIGYSGSPEPTDYDEVDSGNVVVVDLSRDACTARAVRTAKWRFLRETFELSSIEDVADTSRRLLQLQHKDTTILKLTLKGSLSLGAKAQLDANLEQARALFAALEIWERHTDLVVLPDRLDLESLGLSGFARAALDELREAVSRGGEGAGVARDALALLYRLAARGVS